MLRRPAVLSAAALLAFAAVPSIAQADTAGPAIHGCLSTDVCEYSTSAAFDNNAPDVVEPAKASGRTSLPTTTAPSYVVNNSDPAYTSEGNYVLEVPGVLCVYVPDTADEQAAGQAEHTTDGQGVGVVQFGQTAAAADAVTVAALSSCS